jgi:hypothetical protein
MVVTHHVQGHRDPNRKTGMAGALQVAPTFPLKHPQTHPPFSSLRPQSMDGFARVYSSSQTHKTITVASPCRSTPPTPPAPPPPTTFACETIPAMGVSAPHFPTTATTRPRRRQSDYHPKSLAFKSPARRCVSAPARFSLPRPATRVPRRETINTVEPSLAHIPTDYILDSLASHGSWSVSAPVR